LKFFFSLLWFFINSLFSLSPILVTTYRFVVIDLIQLFVFRNRGGNRKLPFWVWYSNLPYAYTKMVSKGINQFPPPLDTKMIDAIAIMQKTTCLTKWRGKYYLVELSVVTAFGLRLTRPSHLPTFMDLLDVEFCILK